MHNNAASRLIPCESVRSQTSGQEVSNAYTLGLCWNPSNMNWPQAMCPDDYGSNLTSERKQFIIIIMNFGLKCLDYLGVLNSRMC